MKLINNKNLAEMQFYDLIIGRYNELGLKSKKVRSRMEYSLLKHISKICIREGLLLVSSYRRSGRLIFHFKTEQIPKAIEVFRHIIGLHSFSPGFSVKPEFIQIAKSVLEYVNSYIEDKDSFAVRASRIKPFSKSSLEIEREIGEQILEKFEAEGKSLKVDLTNPKKTVYIEVREKMAYIYSQKIPTIWGGNPIETDKAVLSLWRGIKGENIATQLMIRRGTVVEPVIIYADSLGISRNGNKFKEILNNIKGNAKYLSEPMKIILLNVESLIKQIRQENLSENDFENYIKYMNMTLLANLLKDLNETKEIIYNRKPLFFKGILTPTNLSDEFYYLVGQRLPPIHFMPLIGLSQTMINDLDIRLRGLKDSDSSNFLMEGTELENKRSKFSLGKTVSSGSLVKKNPADANFAVNNENSGDLDEKLEKITLYFEKEKIRNLINQIINNKEIREIQNFNV